MQRGKVEGERGAGRCLDGGWGQAWRRGVLSRRLERSFVPHTDPPPIAASPSSADSSPTAAASAAARIEAALTGPGAPFAVVRAQDGEQAGSLLYASGPRTLREFVETTWAFGAGRS